MHRERKWDCCTIQNCIYSEVWKKKSLKGEIRTTFKMPQLHFKAYWRQGKAKAPQFFPSISCPPPPLLFIRGRTLVHYWLIIALFLIKLWYWHSLCQGPDWYLTEFYFLQNFTIQNNQVIHTIFSRVRVSLGIFGQGLNLTVLDKLKRCQ